MPMERRGTIVRAEAAATRVAPIEREEEGGRGGGEVVSGLCLPERMKAGGFVWGHPCALLLCVGSSHVLLRHCVCPSWMRAPTRPRHGRSPSRPSPSIASPSQPSTTPSVPSTSESGSKRGLDVYKEATGGEVRTPASFPSPSFERTFVEQSHDPSKEKEKRCVVCVCGWDGS